MLLSLLFDGISPILSYILKILQLQVYIFAFSIRFECLKVNVSLHFSKTEFGIYNFYDVRKIRFCGARIIGIYSL